MSLTKFACLAAAAVLAGCNSIGDTRRGPSYFGPSQTRDLKGMTTDQEDDTYWREREKKECNGIDDQIMRAKCADALRRERASGLKSKM